MRMARGPAGCAMVLAMLSSGCSFGSVSGVTSNPPAVSPSLAPSGAACASDIAAMATKPVATAVAGNFDLSVLAGALKRTGLAPSLDRAAALTLFAPTNRAFARIPESKLHSLVDDDKALTRMVKTQVVSGWLSPQQLPGTHVALAGNVINVRSQAGATTVNDVATVTCANVPTTNAVVYFVDALLDSD